MIFRKRFEFKAIISIKSIIYIFNFINMEKIKRITEIVDSKVKPQENHKIEKLQNYTKEQIDEIFSKFSNQIFEIYWDQTVSFQKLVSWKDRSSFILEVWWKLKLTYLEIMERIFEYNSRLFQ